MPQNPYEISPRNRGLEYGEATPIILPKHLFVPEGAQSVDIRRVADIAAGTANPLSFMKFKAEKGQTVQFIAYAVFSDGTLASTQEFIPRVDGRRVFPFHGDPNDNFKINLGLAPDLSHNSLIPCQLTLQPEQEIEWFVRNTNAVDISMGVRMFGYVDTTQRRNDPRFGG